MKYPENAGYVIAIDSGATKSEVLLYPVGDPPLIPPFVRGGAKIYKYPFINLNLLGYDESLKRLKKIVKDVSGVAGKKNIAAIAAGISGARYEKDRKRLAAALGKATGIKKVFILPDTEIALEAAFAKNVKNCGILIAGTGSILYYRAGDGKINRIGGWGRHIGDEGSGHWIAREALYKVTKHYDKRLHAEKLAVVMKKEFGIDEANIIKHVYHFNFEISKLTRHIFRCAENGDKVSKGIIKEAAENLLTHFIPLKKQKYTIAMMGSLLAEEKLLANELKKAAKKLFPNIKLVQPEFAPVWGAVKYAISNIK
ncbi:MAG TPA: BadF/BadG/BcrA/BcrD ATPase family protein [Ignavibacteria bacterium]|nr:BadF/BadG/BcrA/BcrD ATPase family protein [Ignavibacteria bacterium]HMR00429.1 BadF/BadG/BcrA/BcrD ATPase family protein [Ignavibacteria bacterium]